MIPLQLQKLFAKLLVLDQDSISTADLTDSFGWTGNEVTVNKVLLIKKRNWSIYLSM